MQVRPVLSGNVLAYEHSFVEVFKIDPHGVTMESVLEPRGHRMQNFGQVLLVEPAQGMVEIV